jgi:hypothetical protein
MPLTASERNLEVGGPVLLGVETPAVDVTSAPVQEIMTQIHQIELLKVFTSH